MGTGLLVVGSSFDCTWASMVSVESVAMTSRPRKEVELLSSAMVRCGLVHLPVWPHMYGHGCTFWDHVSSAYCSTVGICWGELLNW